MIYHLLIRTRHTRISGKHYRAWGVLSPAQVKNIRHLALVVASIEGIPVDCEITLAGIDLEAETSKLEEELADLVV